MPRRSASLLGASALALAGACGHPPPGPSVERATPAAGAAKDPITGLPVEPPGPRHEHAKLVEKTDADEHEVVVPPAVQSEIEHCHESGGGKLKVRVRREGGVRTFEAVPGTTLDPAERRCVLDALRRLRDDEVGQSFGSGATLPVTGFTSLLTVEW